MEALLKLLLLSSHGLFAYLGIFSVLVACGLGVPLPEDLSLILGGYLAHEGAVVLPWMIAVGFFGILAGDSLIFFAGRKLGTQGAKRSSFLTRVVTPEKRARVERLFGRHGEKIVMLARFLPGIRAVTYFTAGSAGMGYLRFICFDAMAALGSVPLFVTLGFKFGSRLEWLVHQIKEFQFGVLGLLGTALLVTWLLRRRRAAEAAAASLLAVENVANAPTVTTHDRERFASRVTGGATVALPGTSQVKLAD